MSAALHALATSDPLDTLRRRIADVVAGDAPPAAGFRTGVGPLDAALAGAGGIPRGRLTELLGTAGSGATSLARRLVGQALAAGAWVAYVDATRTLAPRDWAGAEPADGASRLWVVRPPDPARAAWCADVLLRSGGFGLVAADGATPRSRAATLRLLQLARDADGPLVLVGAGTRASDLGGALRLRLRPTNAAAGGGAADGERPPHRRWRVEPGGTWSAVQRAVITVEKGGTHRNVEVSCAVGVARRLCAHPEVPDRRPVARALGRAALAAGVAAGDAARAAAAAVHGDARAGVRPAEPPAVPPKT
ncbi:hypothetical protein PYV61_18740, partial [Roseisolibacter sp. H3M3-2]|nr:hypothetical protein [Roseisolibacter sp. H3M3-2]